MYKVIMLMGQAGAGKDTMLKRVLEKNPRLHEIVSCTTRPPREGEVHGVNYFYYTTEVFGQKVLDGEMLECTVFNDWFYGTSFESLRSDGVLNIGVFNPAGVESLLERKDCDILVFWITASDKTRILRQLQRESDPDVAEILRRFSTDREDFFDVDFDYIEIVNEQPEDLEKGAEKIVAQIKMWNAQGQK